MRGVELLHTQVGSAVEMHNVGFNNAVETVNRLFNYPKEGVTRTIFQKSLGRLGISAAPTLSSALFDRYDSQKRGKIPIYQLVNCIQSVSKDYDGTWNARREDEASAMREKNSSDPKGVLTDGNAPALGTFGRRASRVEYVESFNDALYGTRQSSRSSRSSRSRSSSRRSERPGTSGCLPATSPARGRGRGYVPPRIQQTSLLPRSGRFTLLDTWKEKTPEIGMNGTKNTLTVAPNKLSFQQVKELQRNAHQ
jgi:hypothetical protein